MSDERITPYPLRIPPEMREKLESAAKAGDRSLHAEIMRRLEDSLKIHTLKSGQAMVQYSDDSDPMLLRIIDLYKTYLESKGSISLNKDGSWEEINSSDITYTPILRKTIKKTKK